ncbi:MAG: hypothetical protein Q4D53_06965 [Leptotrichiaceae bacterium]|nr:hypothetical protein [Leptotrichiaceae bacterium]
MTKIIIKNNVISRYDYIVVWINNEKKLLKPHSEICLETYDEEVDIVFSLFSFKSKKKIIKCAGKEEILLELKFNNKKFVIKLMSGLLYVIFVLYNFIVNGFNITTVLITLFLHIFIVICGFVFAIRTIELVEKK